LNELAVQVNLLRSQTLLKTCFEVLKTQADNQKQVIDDLKSKMEVFQSHRDKCTLVEFWNQMRSVYNTNKKQQKLDSLQKVSFII